MGVVRARQGGGEKGRGIANCNRRECRAKRVLRSASTQRAGTAADSGPPMYVHNITIDDADDV
eukprot:12929920-Prorocentrum_lima.AAC.1